MGSTDLREFFLYDFELRETLRFKRHDLYLKAYEKSAEAYVYMSAQYSWTQAVLGSKKSYIKSVRGRLFQRHMKRISITSNSVEDLVVLFCSKYPKIDPTKILEFDKFEIVKIFKENEVALNNLVNFLTRLDFGKEAASIKFLFYQHKK